MSEAKAWAIKTPDNKMLFHTINLNYGSLFKALDGEGLLEKGYRIVPVLITEIKK